MGIVFLFARSSQRARPFVVANSSHGTPGMTSVAAAAVLSVDPDHCRKSKLVEAINDQRPW